MSSDTPPPGKFRPLYAVTIHRTIAGGDLAEMKSIAEEAAAHLAADGDLSAALDSLRIEIAKLEAAIH